MTAVLHGDCLAILPTLPPDSFDSCVTDPPYHLVSIVKRFGKPGSAPVKIRLTDDQAGSPFERGARGFMGKEWDGGDVAARPETWAAVYRVLKPGAHLVAFGGTRTYHRMVCAIEDAGFEIRDCIQWIYGSGFPKSHDVSKGIDRRKDWAALPQLQQAIRTARQGLGVSQSEAARRMGLIPPDEDLGGGGFMWFETGMRMPTRDQWPRLKTTLGMDDEFDGCFEAAEREVIGSGFSGIGTAIKDGRWSGLPGEEFDITAPATDAARQWQGWGTALKPACEPIVLARKPLSESTVAANVLKWGTGAINVDGCRVATGDVLQLGKTGLASEKFFTRGDRTPLVEKQQHDLGRWPANVVHDGSDEVVQGFPDSISVPRTPSPNHHTGLVTTFQRGSETSPYDDSGSAARFFYTAKADGDERIGSKHPTVKPVDLMQWLVRLVTPKGGTVLDPFAGTGTTAEAAWREGCRATLIEREAEYLADIARRMELMKAGPDERAREIVKASGKAQGHEDLPLFAAQQWSDMWAKPFDKPELVWGKK